MDFYLIRVKCRTNFAFLKISKEDLNVNAFRQKALAEFGVSQHVNFHVKLVDMLATPISDEIFMDVIEKYKDCTNFFIELLYRVDFESTVKIVTPFIVQEYLIQNNFDWILKEQNQSKNLSETARMKLVAALCDFMFTFYGTRSLQKTHKLATISAALQMFPQMQSQNISNGGVDILLGYVENRLKYIARKTREVMADTIDRNRAEQNSNEATAIEDRAEVHPVNDDEMRDLINIMKGWTIDTSNLSVMKSNLRMSREYRQKLLLNEKTDLLEYFPYFFINMDLVLFEYADRFNNVNSQSFLDNWHKYHKALHTLFDTQYDTSAFVTTWPDDIEGILSLLKLFPSSKLGRKRLADRATFHRAANKLFVFRTAGLPPGMLIEKENKYPYIIACGETKDKIIRYFIEVEKHLICIPHDFNAIQTFDVFFKFIKIHNLHVDNNILNMMNFIQHFIYNHSEKDFKPTTRMQDVYNRIVRSESDQN